MTAKKSKRPVQCIDGVWHINYSSLALIQDCAKKADYIIHNPSVSTENEASVFGSAIHKALEYFYMTNPESRSLDEMYKSFDDYLSQSTVIIPQETEKGAKGSVRSVEVARKIMNNYFDHYKNDSFIVVSDENGPIVERDFSFQLTPNIVLFGTIDLMVKDTRTNKVYVLDHKTTRSLSGFELRVKPNHQLTGYVWAAKQLGLDCDDAILQGIQVAKTIQNVIRVYTNRDEDDFNEWKMWVNSVVQKWDKLTTENHYPMNGASTCTLWGGCKFIDVCQAPKHMRADVLQTKINNPAIMAQPESEE